MFKGLKFVDNILFIDYLYFYLKIRFKCWWLIFKLNVLCLNNFCFIQFGNFLILFWHLWNSYEFSGTYRGLFYLKIYAIRVWVLVEDFKFICIYERFGKVKTIFTTPSDAYKNIIISLIKLIILLFYKVYRKFYFKELLIQLSRRSFVQFLYCSHSQN